MHTYVQTYEIVMLFIGFSILLLCSGLLTMGHEHHVCITVQLKSILSMISAFKLVE